MSRRKRKKKQNNKGLPIIVFVVVVFCACIGVQNLNLKNQKEALAEKQENLQRQIDAEEERAQQLEDLEKYMQTKKYMEEVAKNKLGLVYPDEILIEPEKD